MLYTSNIFKQKIRYVSGIFHKNHFEKKVVLLRATQGRLVRAIRGPIELNLYYHQFSCYFAIAVSENLLIVEVTLFRWYLRLLEFHLGIVGLELLVGVQYNIWICYMGHELKLCYLQWSIYFAETVSESFLFME